MGVTINIAKAKLDQSGEIKPGWNGEPEYHHYFATHERSIDFTSDKKLKEILEIFRVAFPSPMYHTSVTSWEKRGNTIDVENVLNPKLNRV